MEDEDFENQVFFDKYKTMTKLGQGSFGKVFQGVNLKTSDMIALKFVLSIFIIN